MMFKNKGFSLVLCFLFAFTFIGGLKSQDYVTDLRKANQLLSIAQERDRVAAEALQDVKSRRLRLEEDMTDAQDNPNSISKAEKNRLKSEIKSLQKKEADLLQRRKYANNLLLDVTDILQVQSKKRTKFISEYEKRYGVIKLDERVESQPVTTVNTQPIEEPKPEISKPTGTETNKKTTIAELEKSASNPPQPFVGSDVIAPSLTESDKKESPKEAKAKKSAKTKSVASKKTAINYKSFDLKEDVMAINPSSLDCNLAFDGKDNFTGKKKQETTPITLFAHTDDFMRAAMKDKDFVTCEATATRIEGSRIVYLNLTMTIQTKDAQRTFGFLDRGALIIFRLINGKRISLSTNKTDIGVVDPQKGTTTFRAQLAVAETVELTQSELDAIRVSWSVGYEDYEIFDMDVLRNLFKCLDKK